MQETLAYGHQQTKSTGNAQATQAFRGPGYMQTGEFTNISLATYYAVHFDLNKLPTANLMPGQPGFVAPKLAIEIPPASSLNSKGKLRVSDVEYREKALYSDGSDYFKNGCSIAFSLDPTYYKPTSGVYNVSFKGTFAMGKSTGWDSTMQGFNFGQEEHPAVPALMDGTTEIYPAIPAGRFDTRPIDPVYLPNGGRLHQLCKAMVDDGITEVRINYVSPRFSGYDNWKEACIIILSYFPNALIGVGDSNGDAGGVTKATFDNFVAVDMPAFVDWAVAAGFKNIGISNEADLHYNASSYTSAGVADPRTYQAQAIMAKSVALKTTYPTTVFSATFSEAGRASWAAQYRAGTAHGLTWFGWNSYGKAKDMTSKAVDAKLQFSPVDANGVANGPTQLFVTEAHIDHGRNDPEYEGSYSPTVKAGSELLQAADLIQRRNFFAALGVKVYWFTLMDAMAGVPKDQFGLVTNAGHKTKAYKALITE